MQIHLRAVCPITLASGRRLTLGVPAVEADAGHRDSDGDVLLGSEGDGNWDVESGMGRYGGDRSGKELAGVNSPTIPTAMQNWRPDEESYSEKGACPASEGEGNELQRSIHLLHTSHAQQPRSRGACVCSVADDGFGRDAGSAVGSVEGMRCTIPAASVLLWPRQSVGRSTPAMREGDFLSNVTRLDRPWSI